MAVLKDLIVHGPSRFINTANFNSIKANTIGADNGVFNKLIATSADIGSLDVDDLTAQNATVVGLLDVKGQLHTNSWTNANIANIGGSFYISPTVSTEIAANGTPMSVTISGGSGNRTIAVSGGAFVTDSVKIYQNNTTSTASWAIGSRVMITGNVRLGTTGTDYPLGTCIGYLNASLTTSGFTIAEVNSPALESIISTIGTSLKSYNIKISMYEIGPKTLEKPVGILLTSYGVDRSTYIDIYGGVNTKNSSGYTEPNVRIGYLGGIPSYTDSAGKPHKPTGWGLFTDNGYFKGVIVADSGSIGGTTINATSFYSLVNGTGYSFSNGGEFSITGTDDSYIKMEQTDNDGEIENTLSVQLSKLYMTLGEIYGQDETVNVIEVINDQVTFSQLWEGSSVWLYEKDGNTFDVYEYVNTNGELEYYYDNNQFNPGYYELTNDSEISSSKDYYKPSLLSNNPNDIISLYNYENLNIKSLIVDIDPVQSGSGDPSLTNEKPISGWDSIKAYTSGKNLIWNVHADTYTTNGITYTKTADGKVIANGTATASAWYKLTEGFICKAPMILSGCPSGGGASTYEIQLDGVSNVRDFGSGVSFNTSGSGKFYIVVRSGQTVNNLVFEPMVRLATESAGYEPYQGQTIAKILKSDENIAMIPQSLIAQDRTHSGITWHATSESSWHISGTSTALSVNIAKWEGNYHYLPKGTYTVTVSYTGTVNGTVNIWGYDSVNTTNRRLVAVARWNVPQIFTLEEDSWYVFYASVNSGKTVDAEITIDLKKGQTVYGGTLDIISGELTVTKQLFKLNFSGRTGTGKSNKYGWYSFVIPNIIKPAFTEYPTGMLCDKLAVGTRNESYNALKDCVSIHQTEGRIYTYVESLSTMTLEEAQAWLKENPIEVVYPLETPEIYQLTSEQVQILLKENNIWANSGRVEVKLNTLYQEVGPISNPAAENFYEFITNPEDWQKYTGDISNLTEKLKDGLQSALSFTTDSLQNEQKLLISSGHEKDELETVSIEVDPSFISLIANNEDLTMQFRMNHDALTNTANIQIIDKEEEIFSIEDKNGYVLSTTTGFKAGPLGIFHYKKGLAIGMI